MAPQPHCVFADQLVKECQDIFLHSQPAAVPVLNEARELVGVVSYMDFIRSRQILDTKEFLELVLMGMEEDAPDLREAFNLDSYHQVYDRLSIREIMTTVPLSLPSDLPLVDVADQLCSHRLQEAFVVDEQQHVVGQINALDVVKAVCLPFSV
jgi:Mg/Co/Ni transporter MgtE